MERAWVIVTKDLNEKFHNKGEKERRISYFFQPDPSYKRHINIIFRFLNVKLVQLVQVCLEYDKFIVEVVLPELL